jgi:hypothetical protein
MPSISIALSIPLMAIALVVSGIYSRARYASEMRAAPEKWADFVMTQLGDKAWWGLPTTPVFHATSPTIRERAKTSKEPSAGVCPARR